MTITRHEFFDKIKAGQPDYTAEQFDKLWDDLGMNIPYAVKEKKMLDLNSIILEKSEMLKLTGASFRATLFACIADSYKSENEKYPETKHLTKEVIEKRFHAMMEYVNDCQ